jgi:hypothetical protein
MAVIINDFEVVVDPPPPAPGADAVQPPPPAPPLRPDEIERIVRHFERRRARLHAD